MDVETGVYLAVPLAQNRSETGDAVEGHGELSELPAKAGFETVVGDILGAVRFEELSEVAAVLVGVVCVRVGDSRGMKKEGS